MGPGSEAFLDRVGSGRGAVWNLRVKDTTHHQGNHPGIIHTLTTDKTYTIEILNHLGEHETGVVEGYIP